MEPKDSDRPRPGPRHAPLEAMDGRMIARMRLVLALSALLIIYIDPSEPDRLVAATYGALVLYSLYSAALCLFTLRRVAFTPARVEHWIDVGWYLLLVALSSGTSSIFFFFFFFAVLVASFHRGFGEGLRATVASALLFSVVGFATAPSGQSFELNRFLLRPIYLLVLGYMIAYWGGFEIQLKRRLALLKEVTEISNPRFGIGQTIATIMRRVRAFYDADECLLVLSGSGGGEFRLTRVGREGEAQAELIPAAAAAQFLAPPPHVAAVYNARTRVWQPRDECYYGYDLARAHETGDGRAAGERVAALLDAESFATVPVVQRGEPVGRAYVTGRRGVFGRSDVGFLLQIIEHVTPVLDNVRLLDRLASNAAEQERQKIARDIHDSVIQPYIGLQYKVAAIRNKLAGGADISADLGHLFDVTTGEITGLRHYVRGLKEEGAGRDDLLSAVRRYVGQFGENYGIEVGVAARGEINVNDRLAAELIQIVHEGLSNVRKHTEATDATVGFECRDRHIILRIENGGADGEPAPPFTPRSIAERAENLGGRARVENGGGRTAVIVEIPL